MAGASLNITFLGQLSSHCCPPISVWKLLLQPVNFSPSFMCHTRSHEVVTLGSQIDKEICFRVHYFFINVYIETKYDTMYRTRKVAIYCHIDILSHPYDSASPYPSGSQSSCPFYFMFKASTLTLKYIAYIYQRVQ